MPIQYPPHVVALGSLYVAALLSSLEQPAKTELTGYHSSHQIAALLGRRGEWERKFQTQVEDLEGMICRYHHMGVDSLYISNRSCCNRPSHSIRSKSIRQYFASDTIISISTSISAHFTLFFYDTTHTATSHTLQNRSAYPIENCYARV